MSIFAINDIKMMNAEEAKKQAMKQKQEENWSRTHPECGHTIEMPVQRIQTLMKGGGGGRGGGAKSEGHEEGFD